MTPEEHDAVMNAAAFAGACIAGANTVWNYSGGSRTSVSMTAYWARIAAEVAKNPGGGAAAPLNITLSGQGVPA